MPTALRGKPLRRIQREISQRVYRHPHRNLLVIALPKSGSTWLARMLADAPGYTQWTPPSIKLTDHDLRRADLIPSPAGFTVTKTHTPPTPENVAVVHETERPYVVLIRDLRDVAVSWAHYVALPGRKRVAWPEAQRLPLHDRIAFYIERVLPSRVAWVTGWRAQMHPQHALLVRYEELCVATHTVMQRIFEHFQAQVSRERLERIVRLRSFHSATGRKPGQEDPASFNRKGVAGDWKNHFTGEHILAFKRIAGAALVELGYERDDSW